MYEKMIIIRYIEIKLKIRPLLKLVENQISLLLLVYTVTNVQAQTDILKVDVM